MSHKNHKLIQKVLSLAHPILFVAVIFFVFAVLYKPENVSRKSVYLDNSNSPSEIVKIKSISSVEEQAKIYRQLIERVGPSEAQEDLLKSGLPFSGQTHLLNHTVGDYLYEKFGPSGLVQCKDYFLSSCYHGFILHAIANGGMAQVAKTFDACVKEGPTVFFQCAHGMGHGFLANLGYKDLLGALKTCDEAIKTMKNFPGFNCYDGVFMENIWAVHDGAPSPDRWVNPKDPFYPCDDPRIDPKYILACWSNQPSLAYQLFQGDVKKVATDVCGKVTEPDRQEMCFNGLARQIHPLANGTVKDTLGLCSFMPSVKWRDYCVSVNATAGYSVGDRILPFEICSAEESSGKQECYEKLFATMKGYERPGDNTKNLCSRVSDKKFRSQCESMF